MRLITFGLALLFLSRLNAFSWYLSNDGNDSSPGNSPSTAWQSIAQLNEKLMDATIQPGDSILFHPGHVFEGQITFDYRFENLYFGTWGTDAPPAIIKGSQVVENWTPLGDGIWMAKVLYKPDLLFANNQLQNPARYPNQGWLYLPEDSGFGSITDPKIVESGIDWTGEGNIVLRIEDWKYEVRSIAEQSGNTIVYTETTYPAEKGRNYYLFGKMEALDTLGEWYYQPQESIIYFMPPPGLDPNFLLMEASVFPHGIKGDWNRKQIRIENLHFKHQNAEAVWLGGTCDHNSVRNCIFEHCHTGLFGMGANLLVENNQFMDCYSVGVLTQQLSENSQITGNSFKRIGLEPRFSGNGAIYDISGQQALFARNSIDSSGSNGIYLAAHQDFVVEKNVVRNAMLLLSDGGGIYTCCEAHDGIIRQNFVSATQGDLNGVPGGFANGIYLDNHSHDILIENNTVADIPTDGLIGNAATRNLTFRGNTTYNCGSGLTFGDWQENEPISGCRAVGNTFFALEETQDPMQLLSLWERYDMSSFDSNYYYNPFDFFAVNRSAFWIYPRYTLAAWQKMYPEDQHSKQIWFHTPRNPVRDSSATELILNGSYDLGIGGWSCWADRAYCLVDWVQTSDRNEGALVHTFSEEATQSLVSSPSFAIEAGQWYALKVQLKGKLPQDLELQLKQAYGDFAPLQTIHWLPLAGTTANTFSLTFQSKVSDAEAQLVFISNHPENTIWIDNVSLRPVTVVDWAVQKQYPLLINPTDVPLTLPLRGKYRNLDNEPIEGSITLAPWSAQVLIQSAAPLSTALKQNRLKDRHLPSTRIKVFPNPADTWVQLESEEYPIEKICLRDLLGRAVWEKVIRLNTATLDLSSLPSGTYFLEISLCNGVKQMQRVLKR
jgi:hypothetical protein